jgi:hypothetical protein
MFGDGMFSVRASTLPAVLSDATWIFEAISDTADIGSVACHSAILRATPRHISGRRKSSGEHTLPSMNLYNRPFSNRANNVGASLYLASKECEAASPIEVAVSIFLPGK